MRLSIPQVGAVLLGFGVPNYFTIYGTSNISSDIDINVYIRISIFLFGITVIVPHIPMLFGRIRYFRKTDLYAFLILFYCLFNVLLVTSLISEIYRFFEILLLICLIYLGLQGGVASVYKFLRIIFWYTLINVILMTTIFFDKSGFLDGRFGGSVIHPNSLAIQLTVTNLIASVIYRRYFFWSSLIFGGLVLATLSRFGLALYCFSLAISLQFMARQKVVSAILMFTFVSVVGVAAQDVLITVLSRGESFEYLLSAAGRIDVWSAAIQAYTSNVNILFFGVGFGSPTEIVNDYLVISGIEHWAVPNAHNEYFQVLLSFGALGFGLYLILCKLIFNGIRTVEERSLRRFCITLFLLLLLYGLSWTTVSFYVNYCTLFFIILYFLPRSIVR